MLTRLVVVIVAILLGTATAHADSVRERLEAVFRAGVDAEISDDEVDTFAIVEGVYRARDMRPIWVDESGALPRAHELVGLLFQSDFDGLDPDDYGAGVVGTMLTATDKAALAELDVMLSSGFVQFAADLGRGRTAPNVADPDLFPFREEVDKAAVLLDVESAGDLALYIDRNRPHSPRYDRLRVALADYRTMAEMGGWEPISDGPALKPGMTDPRIAMVRSRLLLWGDLAVEADISRIGGDGDFYDDALVPAVERMQYRHGLAQDGVIGRHSLDAFNVTVDDRIEQIVLNLERRRWLPDDLGPRYVYVNLADFNLKVVDGERTIHETRVVVGRPYHRTPVFSDEIKYLELNPFWNVPPSIARGELLPKIQSDPGYLAENDYALFSDWSANAVEIDPFSVDWGLVAPETFAYKIRQNPGDGNALGRLKFMFPNRFNIYLHDTPAKSLFGRAQRSFSHGCIRVMNPVSLAEIVLSGTAEWTAARINEAIASGGRTVVPLPEPLPVHLSYMTAWVNKDRTVHFRSDIYDRDIVLAEALIGSRRGRAY